MATTIITKNGSGAPVAGDLVQGELAVDLTNKTLYSKDSSGNVFKVGDTGGGSPGTFTDLVATDSFTSPGIDDNANATAITIDANENVGINVVSPARKLDVLGTSGAVTTRIGNSGSTANYMELGGTNGSTRFGHGGSGSFTLLTGGDSAYNGETVAMTVTDAGNVGIGTAAPGAPIDVEGVSGVVMGRFYDGVGTASLKVTTNSNNEVGFAHAGVASGGLTFSTGSGAVGTERMRIDSTGNVGIGGSDRFSFLTNSSGNLQVGGGIISDPGSGVPFEITNYRTSDIVFSTGGSSEKMRIDSAGNVGIGGDPTSPLHVFGDAKLEEASPTLTLSDTSDGSTHLLQSVNTALNVQGAGQVRFSTSATERMRIDSSGNVGIGSTDPKAPLTVAGTPTLDRLTANFGDGLINASGYQRGVINVNGRVNGVDGDADISFVTRTAADSNWLNAAIGQDNTGALTFANYGIASGAPTERMRIDAAGKITAVTGTSTSAPIITGTAAQGQEAGVKLYREGTTRTGLSLFTQASGVDSDVIYCDSDGNVGIGNNSPGYQLQMSGTTGFAVDTTGLLGAANETTIGTTSGGESFGLRSSGSGYMKFSIGSAEAMRIDNSGNLLVGRTSVTAGQTDYGWQATNAGIVFQYADVSGTNDVHRWYSNHSTTQAIATLNARGEAFFLGGSTFSGTVTADKVVQDGAPVIDTLQIIRAFMKLRAATADPDSTVDELRVKLSAAVDDIIDQFQDQIDNLDLP